jgi:hypothetical protein
MNVILDYHSEARPSAGWRRGDGIFAGAAVGYAALNVGMLLLARGDGIGPALDMLRVFFFASLLGMVIAFPVQLTLRRAGVTWRGALVVIVILLLLAGLNLWWAVEAIASV